MNYRQLSTALAALRIYQDQISEQGIESVTHMPHFADVEPLDIEEIDKLCEQLNGSAQTNPPTPVLEEIKILLSAASYWTQAEADEEHPDPMDIVCDAVREANELFQDHFFPEESTDH